MGALKRIDLSVLEDARAEQPVREIAPADYSDEVSNEQFEHLENLASEAIGDGDEWQLVAGPAW